MWLAVTLRSPTFSKLSFFFWGGGSWGTTPYGKIFEIPFGKFSSRHRSTMLLFKFREIWPTRNRRNRALFTIQKKSPACQTVATAPARIAPKICKGQLPEMYSECSRFHPNRFTFGWVIAERVNTATYPRKVNPISDQSLASSWIIIIHVVFPEVSDIERFQTVTGNGGNR